ncbi:MAG: hypothetical protein ACOYMN_01820 [Roseimicrobium sp.]
MSWLRRIFWLTLLALAASAAAYVQSAGFSASWRAFVIEQFEQRGVYLTFDKLTLDPFEGLVARDIRFFLDKPRQVLLAKVDRLHLDLDYSKMARSELFLEGVDLRSADVTFPIDPEDPLSQQLKLDALSARLYLSGDRIEIRKAEGNLYGLRFQVHGELLRPPANPTKRSAQEVEESKQRRVAAFKARRELILEVAKVLQRLGSAEAPMLDVQVNGDLEHPAALTASLRLSARNLTVGNYRCEELDAAVTYAGEQVDVSRLHLKDHLGDLEAGATWQVGGDEVHFHLRSSADLPGLASAFWAGEELREFVFYDPLELTADGRILLDKAVPEGAFLPVECVGTLHAGRFSTRGEVLEGLETNFGLSTQGCYLRDGLLRHKTGSMSFQAMWQQSTGFRYQAQVQLDPRIFVPFLNQPETQEIFKRFGFRPDSGIYGELQGEGPTPKLSDCQNHGRLDLHNFTYRGAEMAHASAEIAFSGHTHTYRNVELWRKEGRVTAKEVHCDDHAHTVKLTELVCDADPVTVSRCFDSKTADVIAGYRFDKHPHTEVEGLIAEDDSTNVVVKFRSTGTAHYQLWDKDYTISKPVGELHFVGPLLHYDVRGSVFGESMVCIGTSDLRPHANSYSVEFDAGSFPYEVFGKPLPFEKVAVQVRCKDGHATFETKARLLDGRYRLSGTLDDTRKPQPYTGELLLDAISFNKFARIYSPKIDTPGDFTGHFRFTGLLGDWRALKGEGALAILNSNLYAVPILGPLTPLLGAVLPRPISGYNVAKEGDCTFKVADGFAVTEDFEALTAVFRLICQGKVDFLEDRIQFEAQARFRGLPGLVLFPVSEILEYVGEGSVGSPLWRPRYFSGSKEKTEFRKPGEKPDQSATTEDAASSAKESRFGKPGDPAKK